MKKLVYGIALVAVVGCVHKTLPTITNSGISSVSSTQTSQPPASSNTPSQGTVQQPSVSPTTAVIVADSNDVTIATVSVGDPALQEAVRFTVQSSKSTPHVTVKVADANQPEQLFKVRDDEFGQTELVSVLNVDAAKKEVNMDLPGAGSYLVAGPEKPLSFANTPYVDPPQYTAQTIAPPCPDASSSITLMIGDPVNGYPADVYARTADTTYPIKVDVYIHPGMGSDTKPPDYSFAKWVNYNKTTSPDKNRLASQVKDYIVDSWNTRLAPDSAVGAYLQRRRGCGDTGRPWIDVCHSAGCNKARIAGMASWPADFWNNEGLIAVDPAFGGSHLAIKELVDGTIARQHLPLSMAVLSHLLRLDAGFIAKDTRGRLLVDVLKGTSKTLLNECARSLSWDGRGAGLPTVTYNWFSIWDIVFPFLTEKLTPDVRFTMPMGDGAMTNYAPETHIDSATNTTYYNYVEAIETEAQQYGTYHGFSTDGSVDVIAGYLVNGVATGSQAFMKRFSNDTLLGTLWNHSNLELDVRFQGDALAWMNTVIGLAPSVAATPSEATANDGMVTVSQQLDLGNGSTILDPGSRYNVFTINDDAIRARLPKFVRKYRLFPDLNHAQAVIGMPAVWDQMNEWLLERLAPLHQVEQNLVLTDDDKKAIQKTLFPEGGRKDITLGKDWNDTLGIHTRYRTFVFYGLDKLAFTQDPLVTGQKNRVRMSGVGSMTVTTHTWSTLFNQFQDTGFDSQSWNISDDFIKYNGVWHLVVSQ